MSTQVLDLLKDDDLRPLAFTKPEYLVIRGTTLPTSAPKHSKVQLDAIQAVISSYMKREKGDLYQRIEACNQRRDNKSGVANPRDLFSFSSAGLTRYSPILVEDTTLYVDRNAGSVELWRIFKSHILPEFDPQAKAGDYLLYFNPISDDPNTTTALQAEATSCEADSSLAAHLLRLVHNGQRQIILTGAPGTGKTYTAKEVAKLFLLSTGNPFYRWYRDHNDSLPDRVRAGMTKLLYDQGSGGVMETYRDFFQAKDCLEIPHFWDAVADLRGRMAFSQFHPSYDYTDFVEGLRPVELGGSMHFKRLDGVFKAFCRYVALRPRKGADDYYFFLIDEINRADLSKVLGELMFSLEGDKRGSAHRVRTQYSNLPTHGIREPDCFADGFYIPENVVVIGTMNDIDRSVESMDFALRRRFIWEEVVVDDALLTSAFRGGRFFSELTDDEDLLAQIQSGVKARLLRFNQTMHTAVSYLNCNYDISQGHFCTIPAPDSTPADSVAWVDYIMDWVWTYRVRPLLCEYLRGDNDPVQNLTRLQTAWFFCADSRDVEDNPR